MLYRIYASNADRDEQQHCALSAGTRVNCGSGCGSVLGTVHVHIWFDGATFPIGARPHAALGNLRLAAPWGRAFRCAVPLPTQRDGLK